MGESSPATGPPQRHLCSGNSMIINFFILQVENQRKKPLQKNFLNLR